MREPFGCADRRGDGVGVAIRDYLSWHEEYDRPGSPHYLRLLVVQDLIARALEELPPGPLRLLSMCAGQGRDVLTVAARHRRGTDLVGRLVELDPRNVEAAREAIASLGLHGLHVVQGDAGLSDAYQGATPAELVVACGIFGNVTDDDIERTVRFLPSLCAPGAWVIWTRYPRPQGILDSIGGWFSEAGFEPVALVAPEAPLFGVGAGRLVLDPQPFRPGLRLFQFVR